MTKSLSNVLKSTSISNILPTPGNTGNILLSTGISWTSSALPTYTLPTANTTTLGGVKVDGTTIVANNGIISANVSSGASSTKTLVNKTGAYTIVAGDLGKIINCTSGTFTVSLTAAATLGSGFTCTIWNTSNSAATITIDPDLSETISGFTTWTLRSGEFVTIVCDGTAWQLDSKSPMRSYSENNSATISSVANASGQAAIAVGSAATAPGLASQSFGFATNASSEGSTAIGYRSTAGSLLSTAIGAGSGYKQAITATGDGAMALGGSYASGTDSFAAAIGNNTSSYGATNSGNIALGTQCKSSGAFNAVAMGGYSTASGGASIAMGYINQATGDYACAIGGGSNLASGQYSVALGRYAIAAQIGKYSFASGAIANAGDAQYGLIVLRTATTTTTAVVLTSDGAAATTTNQLIVATNQAMTFFGTLIAKQSASANMASYMFKGSIVNNGGTVSISSISIDTIVDTIGLGAVPTFTADNTNKALAVTSGYKSATNIRWVANIDSVEVTYA